MDAAFEPGLCQQRAFVPSVSANQTSRIAVAMRQAWVGFIFPPATKKLDSVLAFPVSRSGQMPGTSLTTKDVIARPAATHADSRCAPSTSLPSSSKTIVAPSSFHFSSRMVRDKS
jgi:hypothetical protein